MPITARISRTGARSTAACGNIGIANRRKPYVPIFSSTPASTTEPAVGASVWASGSHVWKGTSGIFTAKPMANATNNHFAVATDTPCADDAQLVSTRTSKVRWPVACWCRNATDRMPTNRNAEPAAVYRKNFTAAYRRLP